MSISLTPQLLFILLGVVCLFIAIVSSENKPLKIYVLEVPGLEKTGRIIVAFLGVILMVLPFIPPFRNAISPQQSTPTSALSIQVTQAPSTMFATQAIAALATPINPSSVPSERPKPTQVVINATMTESQIGTTQLSITKPQPGPDAKITVRRQPDKTDVFEVEGASNVKAGEHVYIALSLLDSRDWYVQTSTRMLPGGNWIATCYTGDAAYTRQVGDRLLIVAIIVSNKLPDGLPPVQDLNDLKPVAISPILTVTIEKILQ